jgi:hypothetical protein
MNAIPAQTNGYFTPYSSVSRVLSNGWFFFPDTIPPPNDGQALTAIPAAAKVIISRRFIFCALPGNPLMLDFQHFRLR